jgi:RNA polymerase sigma factor (sigma-70 family)
MNHKRLNNRQRQIWERLFLHFYPPLLANAKMLTDDMASSEDLVQETIVRCLSYAPKPQKIRNPLGYLIRTMRHAWLDDKHKVKAASLDDPTSPEALATERLTVEVDPLRSLENEELLKRLYERRGVLASREERLLELLLGGNTNEEIAQELGEDIGVIRSDMNALKAKLRYRLRNRKHAEANLKRS